jgi:hypothetical protein
VWPILLSSRAATYIYNEYLTILEVHYRILAETVTVRVGGSPGSVDRPAENQAKEPSPNFNAP